MRCPLRTCNPNPQTTSGRRTRWLAAMLVSASLLISAACSAGHEHGPNGEHAGEHGEQEALSRTEFTDRIENFFEHEPLVAGKASQFLIHLTDLQDGSPVEKAEVTLVARAGSGAAAVEARARVGKVTGIYVADVALPSAGKYEVEFRIRNEKIDERMTLGDFEVAAR